MAIVIRRLVPSSVLALTLASMAVGQPPADPEKQPPVPVKPDVKAAFFYKAEDKEDKASSLEKMLEEALKNNPDVQVAEAKVHEAEAALHQARMQLMQKVVALQSNLRAQRVAIQAAEATFERVRDLHKKGTISDANVTQAEAELLAAKAKLGDLESQAAFLTGKHQMTFLIRFRTTPDDAESRLTPLVGYRIAVIRGLDATVAMQKDAPPGSTADKLRKALEKPVSFEYKERALEEVLKEFQEKHGVPFVLATKKLGETRVTAHLTEAPFGAALELLEDTLPGIHFAVRDYGVLVTNAERLPPGAVPIYTFWKAAPASDPAPTKPPTKP